MIGQSTCATVLQAVIRICNYLQINPETPGNTRLNMITIVPFLKELRNCN